MRGENTPPDFGTDLWRLINIKNFFVADIKNNKIVLVGEYQFYISESNAEIGYEIYTEKHKPLCKLWQKKIFYKGVEKTLGYIAYKENNEWVVRRLSNIIVEGELQRNKKTNKGKITIFFNIITEEGGSFTADL